MSDINAQPLTHAKQIPEQTLETCCPIVELRQYIHQPGRREEFIAMFDEHFIEEQERYGAHIIGHFRDRNDPDQFVWLRGFSDMKTRHAALEGFYHSSPLWQEHRMAANDTISNIDNVLLLRPAHTTTGFRFDPAKRPGIDAQEQAGGVFTAMVYTFDAPVDPAKRPGIDAQEQAGGVFTAMVYTFDAPVHTRFINFFEKDVAPLLSQAGATLLAHFVTEPDKNTFPALPVREGEHVFVWFASFADDTTYKTYQQALRENQKWTTTILPALQLWLVRPEETLELLPTRRSFLRFRGNGTEV